jgi:hypothetical protein
MAQWSFEGGVAGTDAGMNKTTKSKKHIGFPNKHRR